MKSVCLRYAHDSEQAQDYMQEGFIRLFDKLESYRGDSSLETWSTRLFINNCLSLLKKDKKLRDQFNQLDEGMDYAEEVIEVDEDLLSADQWLELMQELPLGYRTVLNLYVFENKGHKEIADELGISENTSKSQLFKARRMLKELLEKNGH
ncbi:MAG: sigma-70 family RNA polymerase sigma factor [Bacteroidota bacterium]|nr:sigma-70 family RNA polymerase sigma factor [Bacteroidota bacterium]MDX5431381.1 sigma-70 family RNA polymerase sigma factor [Bacteroidota bacterium]MDX5470111.1 sigma-70 family RNA polymerase sigma factor [Bacteroidota bacterium]